MIHFIIAHQAEAKPLIARWRLKKATDALQPFVVYTSDDAMLIVSGTGKTHSAAATAWLASRSKNQHARNTVWLNLGIARASERRYRHTAHRQQM